jgi:ubiquinone/menaquinone biosynthesis C-methylase UbiE
MSGEKRNFDQEAASWDAKPARVKLAADIAQTITGELKLTSSMDVLDFGCGTGLLTMQLQPFVHFVTGVDSSQGMLDVFEAKIQNQNLTNVQVRRLDIEKDGVLEGSYNLIVSSMTFHHIKEIKPLLNQFHNILLPAGHLCIADLDLDDGQFHENNDGVFHCGFNRESLGDLIRETGFRDIRYSTVARLTKPVSGGGTRAFTIFLMTCFR